MDGSYDLQVVGVVEETADARSVSFAVPVGAEDALGLRARAVSDAGCPLGPDRGRSVSTLAVCRLRAVVGSRGLRFGQARGVLVGRRGNHFVVMTRPGHSVGLRRSQSVPVVVAWHQLCGVVPCTPPRALEVSCGD